jgi:hypothetical protein
VSARLQNPEHVCCNLGVTGIFDEKTVPQHSAAPNASDGVVPNRDRDAIGYNEFTPGWALLLRVNSHFRSDLRPKDMAPPRSEVSSKSAVSTTEIDHRPISWEIAQRLCSTEGMDPMQKQISTTAGSRRS